jgi:hypothetical protein
MARDFAKPLQRTVAKEGTLIKEEGVFLEGDRYTEDKIIVTRTYEYLNKQYLIFFDQDLILKYPDVQAEELEF